MNTPQDRVVRIEYEFDPLSDHVPAPLGMKDECWAAVVEYDFDGQVGEEEAIKTAKHLSGLKDQVILTVSTALIAPRLAEWTHRPNLSREGVIETFEDRSVILDRADYKCVMEEFECLESDTGSAGEVYVITPRDRVFKGEISGNPGGNLLRSYAWWEWQFNRLVDLDLRWLGQLPISFSEQ